MPEGLCLLFCNVGARRLLRLVRVGLMGLSFALAVTGIAPSSVAPVQAQAAISASRWSTVELTLSAGNTYANPYTDVEVSATFTSPSGRTLRVRGFWDGGRLFRVRFTPTETGSWSYRTASIDPGLNGQAGFITVSDAEPGQHGFLRRDDAHQGYSFVYDDGTRYFMWGQTYYEILRNALAGDAWQAALDRSRAHGLNKVRLLIYPWPADNPYPDSEPFVAGDHDELNLRHWQKLDEVVRYLQTRGMVADLILFTDAERAFGSQAQDERYTRYLLARYAAFSNVIWCLTNEWNLTDRDQPYWNRIGEIVRDEDAWIADGGQVRPLSIHSGTQDNFPFFDARWPAHAIVQYGWRGDFDHGDEWGNHSIVNNLGRNRPVVNDEYGYIGDPSRDGRRDITRIQHRRAIWGIAVAGGYGSAGDTRTFDDGDPYFSANWHDAEEYGDLQRLIDFFTTRVPYWRMTSQNAIVAGGARVYALGHPELGYVIYSAAGDVFTLNLPSGNYRVTVFNPRNGELVEANPVSGGSRSFTPPSTDDWVWPLERTSASPPPTNTALPLPTSTPPPTGYPWPTPVPPTRTGQPTGYPGATATVQSTPAATRTATLPATSTRRPVGTTTATHDISPTRTTRPSVTPWPTWTARTPRPTMTVRASSTPWSTQTRGAPRPTITIRPSSTRWPTLAPRTPAPTRTGRPSSTPWATWTKRAPYATRTARPSSTPWPTWTSRPRRSATPTLPAYGGGNLARTGFASASSSLYASTGPTRAIDGVRYTSWISAPAGGPQWWQVDLAQIYALDEIRLNWLVLRASDFEVQVSVDGQAWTTIAALQDANGQGDVFDHLDVQARYVRVWMTRARWSNLYALSEIEIYGR